jgi:cell division protein FtsL
METVICFAAILLTARCSMSKLVVLLIIWGVLTTILVVLLIYRSTLTMHEDEQLFLDESSSHMGQEQQDLLKRVNKINPLRRLAVPPVL